jgi:hypothetical protein
LLRPVRSAAACLSTGCLQLFGAHAKLPLGTFEGVRTKAELTNNWFLIYFGNIFSRAAKPSRGCKLGFLSTTFLDDRCTGIELRSLPQPPVQHAAGGRLTRNQRSKKAGSTAIIRLVGRIRKDSREGGNFERPPRQTWSMYSLFQL